MNKKITVTIFLLLLLGVVSNSCKKSDNKTNKPSVVKDFDGNIYDTVVIGNQVWMVQNLKVTHYRNGDRITLYLDNKLASETSPEGAYYDYNNRLSTSDEYGKLYNWYVVNDSRKVAPEGWHVRTWDEWVTLDAYMENSGMPGSGGGGLKESGITHWNLPNEGADNRSGFTALPGGFIDQTGSQKLNIEGWWWSSSSRQNPNPGEYMSYLFLLSAHFKYASMFYSKQNYAYSIRCIRD